MGFGISTSPQPVAQSPNVGGFNFGAPTVPTQVPPTNPQGNFGFNLLGTNSPATQTTVPSSSNTGFQPIANTNPNKILGYENQHLQIWMDCIK